MSTRERVLPPAAVERSMRLSRVEGMLGAAMVGVGESYFVADELRLGGTPLQLALVVTLPLLIGAAGPLLSLRLLQRATARRPIVVSACAGQAFVLGWLAVGGNTGPNALIAAACLYQLFGQCSSHAWSSWYGDLVPPGVRGAYFALRNRLVHLATFVGLVGGGFLLSLLEPASAAQSAAAGAGGAGFAVIYALAALFRLGSVAVLAASPEGPFHGLAPSGSTVPFLRSAGGRNARWLLLGGGLFQLAVYTSSPFYAPFMLGVLRFDYVTYMVAAGWQVFAKVLAIAVWGRAVDRHGALSCFVIASIGAALIPLPWIWAEGLALVLVAQTLSGLVWGGQEVSRFALLLESTSPRERPMVFAVQNPCNALGQVSGGLAGSVLLAAWGYPALFAASLLARLAAAAVFPFVLRDPRELGVAPRRPHLLLRVLGFRPGPGLVHRPILTEDEPGDDERGG